MLYPTNPPIIAHLLYDVYMKLWSLLFLICGSFYSLPIAAQTVTLTIPMSMGTTEFTGSPNGTVLMATNGNMRYGNGLSGVVDGVPGVFIVTRPQGSGAVDVDISCAATATLAHSSGATLSMTPRISIRRGRGFNNSNSHNCLGLNTVVETMTLRNNANNNDVFVGGEIFTAGAGLTSGIYNTSNAGGVPITVRIVLQ